MSNAISTWDSDDQPREKLLSKGNNVMSNAELIAILIRSGGRSESAVSLSQRILKKYNHNLNNLGLAKADELMDFKGIGVAKAISIVAALELGRRRQSISLDQKKSIRSSKDIYDIIGPALMDLEHEEFHIFLVNTKNQIIDRKFISKGGATATIVDSKMVFKAALISKNTTGIVLIHNHPSGNPTPSEADIKLTKKLKEAGEVLDIRVLDHLVIGFNKYYSFRDEGII